MRQFIDPQSASHYIQDMIEDYLPEVEKNEAALYVIRDTRFITGFGSRSKHHAFSGGLVCHTAEVLSNCLAMAATLDSDPAAQNGLRMKQDVLVMASIWHDYMKIADYEQDQYGMAYTAHKKLIYHVADSYAEFVAQAKFNNLDKEFIQDVGHCILSHHGRPEWGSAITPQTPEALVLHTADCLSSWWSNDPNGRFTRD